MTVGGSGDVLAGLTAGLLARGCRPFDAGRLALLWLTTCADQLWQGLGPCYDPLDLIGALPSALQAGLSPLGLWPPVTAPDGQP
jgi:NAD(P)H-hydrate repair Nnr-like enzyme with NAD(P)H-hydrate dehydratase domain